MSAVQDVENVVTSESSSGAVDGIEYPDGGRDAWLQILAGAIAQALAWGSPAAFGIYQLYYTGTMGLENSKVAWIGSIQTFITFLMSTFAGRMADAGFERSLVMAGSFLAVFGLFMTSIASAYWQIFLAQGVCTGLGLGCLFLPTVSVVSSYFNKKRALALAITASGSAIGSVIFSAAVQYLIPQVGFQWAVRCGAFIALFLTIVLNIIFKPRELPIRSGPLLDLAAFKEPTYLLFTIASFFVFWGLYFVTTYINAFAVTFLGFDDTTSVSLLLIVNAASLPLRPILGWVADRYTGPVNAYILANLLMGIVIFVWIAIWTPSAMYAFAVIYGLVNGAVQGSFPGALSSLTKDPSKAGTRFGMVCTIVGFATLAGPPTAGQIIDSSHGKYLGAQIWAGSIIVLSAVLATVAKRSNVLSKM
ncbi:major facilitator superfamily domain-containing protein [Xylariales sp. PMI_506]|nr:major facilitator superfamily domain-containing protein [Xylariales sp. PMI_506]